MDKEWREDRLARNRIAYYPIMLMECIACNNYAGGLRSAVAATARAVGVRRGDAGGGGGRARRRRQAQGVRVAAAAAPALGMLMIAAICSLRSQEDDILEIPEGLDIQAGDDADIDHAEDATKKEEEKWTDLALEAFEPPPAQGNT